MPIIRITGGIPASIAENSGPADWIANLGLAGDLSRLAGIEITGPMASYFTATWNPTFGFATLRPDARLDFEAFSAAGILPQVEIGLTYVFDDGTRQTEAAPLRLAVLDRDDTAPTGLAFSSGGTVAAGAIGAVIGTLWRWPTRILLARSSSPSRPTTPGASRWWMACSSSATASPWAGTTCRTGRC